jgi:hypothetical protein
MMDHPEETLSVIYTTQQQQQQQLHPSWKRAEMYISLVMQLV